MSEIATPQIRFSARHTIAAVCLLLCCGIPSPQAAETYRLNSPDGRIQVSIQMPAAGSMEPPRWSVSFRGKHVLSDCRLGLQTTDANDLMAGGATCRH